MKERKGILDSSVLKQIQVLKIMERTKGKDKSFCYLLSYICFQAIVVFFSSKQKQTHCHWEQKNEDEKNGLHSSEVELVEAKRTRVHRKREREKERNRKKTSTNGSKNRSERMRIESTLVFFLLPTDTSNGNLTFLFNMDHFLVLENLLWSFFDANDARIHLHW